MGGSDAVIYLKQPCLLFRSGILTSGSPMHIYYVGRHCSDSAVMWNCLQAAKNSLGFDGGLLLEFKFTAFLHSLRFLFCLEQKFRQAFNTALVILAFGFFFSLKASAFKSWRWFLKKLLPHTVRCWRSVLCVVLSLEKWEEIKKRT